MRWRDYFGVIAGMFFFGWLRTAWSSSTGIAAAVFVAIVAIGTVIQRVVRRRRFRKLAELGDEALRVAVEALPAADAALGRMTFGITFEPDHQGRFLGTRTFPYRAGSQSLNTYFFWVCLALSVLMAYPVVLGRVEEPGQMLPWIILAGITLLAGFGYRLLGREMSAQVVLSPRGISIVGAELGTRSLDWLEIKTFRWLRAPGDLYRGIELYSGTGHHLLLDTEIPDYDEIIEQVIGRLVSIHRATE